MEQMKTLNVDLGDRSYPIYIGSEVLQHSALLTDHIKGQQVMVVTNETVAPLYLEPVLSLLAGFQCETVILPDGEQYKTLEIETQIFDALLSHRFDRGATLVALGGGVIGDMTGFAAACYQRGVNFVQIPTTLLAQVDSSVGGKTGVNHPLGKNMIGAFYQPQCVLIDVSTLATLDDRQLAAGLAEVVKYGLLGDSEFFDWLEANAEALLARDEASLIYAIERSCINKADIVAQDEREGGVRALLNLGHTFGHAIETGMGYGEWLHGEAVAAGMCMAATFSRQLGWLSEVEELRAYTLMKKMGLPTAPPATMSAARFIELMAVDKKVIAGQLRLVLLKAIGASVVTADFDGDRLLECIEACCESASANE